MPRGRFLSIIGLYAVLSLASLPLALGAVPPNRWYGFLRIPSIRNHSEAWYGINALGGRLFLSAMLICAAINLLIYWKGSEIMHRMIVWINAGMIFMSFWLISLELINRFPG